MATKVTQKRPKTTPADREKRRADLRTFMEKLIQTNESITLDFIHSHFNHASAPSRSTISHDLEAIHCKKVDGSYQFEEDPEKEIERRRRERHRHGKLVKQFVVKVMSRDVCWLPLQVRKGYAEGVAFSLKELYPDRIKGVVCDDRMIFVAFTSSKSRDFVREELIDLTMPTKTETEEQS